MKILLLGESGQVGCQVKHQLENLKYIDVITPPRDEVDFLNHQKLTQTIDLIEPDIIVNAVAFTMVDKAEEEFAKANAINADAVELLAKLAKRHNAWLIHYSTDYVFDGNKPAPYTETDIPNPLNVYGKTKLKGDLAIQQSGCKYLIFRTSWVYSNRRVNFIQKITDLIQNSAEIKVVNDQIGAPTDAQTIANITITAIKSLQESKNVISGIYNLANQGQTSFYDIAMFVKTYLATKKITPLATIEPVSAKQFNAKALRPQNSMLNCQKLCDTFNVTLPLWEDRLHATLSQIL